jgi:hypothetical protein
MAASVVTTPLVRDRNLPPPLLLVSRIVAVVLIAGSTLQLAEKLIEPALRPLSAPPDSAG